MLIIAVHHFVLLGMLLFLYIACVMIFLSSNSRRLRCNTRPRGLQQPSVLVCVCSPPLHSPHFLSWLLPSCSSSRLPLSLSQCIPPCTLNVIVSLSSTSISTLPHVSCHSLAPLSASLIYAGFEKQAWRLVHLVQAKMLGLRVRSPPVPLDGFPLQCCLCPPPRAPGKHASLMFAGRGHSHCRSLSPGVGLRLGAPSVRLHRLQLRRDVLR